MKLKFITGIKRLLAISHDIFASTLSWVLAYQLRFNFEVPSEHFAAINFYIIFVALVQMLSFFVFGLYRGIWRFASLIDLQRIILAVILSLIILLALYFFLHLSIVVPRSVFLIDAAILILIMGGSRFFYRIANEHQLYGSKSSSGEPVVILGTDQMALSLSKELSKGSDWRVIGMLSEDKSLHRREMSGVKVLGSLRDIPELQSRFGFSRLILAQPFLSYQERRFVVEQAKALNVKVLIIPAAEDLLSGRLNISQLRPFDVEDLLCRDVVNLDNSGLSQLINGHAVLISGAGGSIGSELCRQVIKFNPTYLVCFDISEYALYQLEQELISKGSSVKLLYIVGDVKNASRLGQIITKYQPKVVFHAAAYKHVPLMENGNVSEALNNNVLGTYIFAKACKVANVEKFVLVSTDKAVNPTNIMGATKRLAEMVCQGLQDEKGTRFLMVRFGNVLGSSGSVIPKFRQQIAAGGPITVTHPDITRYFMSIQEAAQLVMQAGLMGKGGEIFVLDMGEAVRIVDLAKDMIKLSGLQEDEIAIEYTGLRPGEKLFEELLADDEHTLPTPHKKLRIASAKQVDKKWLDSLLKWITTINDKEELLIKEELKTWVEDYQGDVNA